MPENTIPFDELMEEVLKQLGNHGYMDSTLIIYRRTYNRVHKFINQHFMGIYTKETGEEFLNCTNVCENTLPAYKCAIRRLNDCLEGKPYRCHHGNPSAETPEIFVAVLESYLNECKNSGNAPATVIAKEKSCIAFLNYIKQSGCSNLAFLNATLVSQALLIFTNKDHYACIRLFLKYLADRGITKSDLSIIVPRYTKRKVLPTTYTPMEISKVESSIDITTDVGIRNLAIIRIATRMGLRAGDIAKLKWTEVDFSTGHISIIQEKTGMPLSLQMPQEVYDSLLKHLNNLSRIPEDGFVFHSMTAPYGRITTNIIRHAVTDAFMVAGINISGKKHGPHAFRSSLASSMVNDGASYETVRKILGHTDPNVIKHYAKTDIEKLRLCSIEPPAPSGLFGCYLSGKKVIRRV